MPFKALLDGQEMISFLITDAQWAACREASQKDQNRLIIPGSGLPCFGRVSSPSGAVPLRASKWHRARGGDHT